MVAPLISVMAGSLSLIMALSILTLNCNGIRDQPKRAGLVQWLRSLPVSADIVCLQEMHCLSLSECSMWFQSSGFSCALSCGSVHSCGCVVLFRPSLSLVNSWGDDDGHYLQCEFVFCGKLFRVCCIYAPNRNPARDQFFDDLQAKADPSVPTILCGDLMRFSIGRYTSLDLTHLTCLVRVPPLSSIFLMLAVQLIFGGISIPLHLAFLGPGGMATMLPVLTFVVFLMCGYLLFSCVIFIPVPFLTVVVSSLLSRSRMLFHLAPVSGSSILLSCRSRRMSF